MLFQDELVLGTIVGELYVLSTGPINDLGVNVYQSKGKAQLRIDFETNPNLYTETEARAHHSRFLEFLARFLIADAEQTLRRLSIASRDHHRHALRGVHPVNAERGESSCR
ncbi:hypothetical protein [Nocardia gipuzkoensis]|uniref:hypothetical protein n=1 Tax=Nocardia gipuzkoensis TaxID=2749991 RepID=UPI00237E2DB1|nr:hypothetical protein [Nocardia gipuzkoensis]MDE1675322.1 hypothetical protein [Nocardia gipuzkoensis]